MCGCVCESVLWEGSSESTKGVDRSVHDNHKDRLDSDRDRGRLLKSTVSGTLLSRCTRLWQSNSVSLGASGAGGGGGVVRKDG